MRFRIFLFLFIATLGTTAFVNPVDKELRYSNHISVNFFLLDECRICQNISGEIKYVHEHYQNDQFEFKCYFPKESSTTAKIESFMKHYNLSLPFATDHDKKFTEFYGAMIAPQVVVYDEDNNEVLYSGRIDNSYARLGIRRRSVSSRDLRRVLNAIKSNDEINPKESKAIGCIIN